MAKKISIFVAPENKTRRVKVMATSVFAYVLITSNKKNVINTSNEFDRYFH